MMEHKLPFEMGHQLSNNFMDTTHTSCHLIRKTVKDRAYRGAKCRIFDLRCLDGRHLGRVVYKAQS